MSKKQAPVDESKAEKNYLIRYLVMALGFLALGICMLVFRQVTPQFIGYLCGGAVLLYSVVRIAMYFVKNDASQIYRTDLATGIVVLFVGLYIIMRNSTVYPLVPVAIGFVVVFGAVIKLQFSFDVRRTAFPQWWLLLVATALSGAIGTLFIVWQGLTQTWLGSLMIAEGVIDLLVVILVFSRLAPQPAELQQAQVAASPPEQAQAVVPVVPAEPEQQMQPQLMQPPADPQ